MKKGGEIQVVDDLPVPQPKCTEVLIKVFTVGVNPADHQLYSGKLPFAPDEPYTPCTDVAGFVHTVGRGVTKFKRGEPVYTVRASWSQSGACAEYMAVSQDHVNLLQGNLNFSQGAALGVPYFSAYAALFISGKAKPGQTVLVHGASGAVGVACCQLAAAHGLTVIGSAGTQAGQEVACNNGAKVTVNHNEADHHLKVKKYTEDRGVDLIIETHANTNLNTDLDMIAHGGTIVVVGCGGGDPTASINTAMFLSKQCHVAGLEMLDSTKEEWVEMAAAVQAGVEQGYIRPVIAEEFPLSEIQQAFAEVDKHKTGARGKVIISLN